jgi:uncharacterized protein (TIGR00661 family)
MIIPFLQKLGHQVKVLSYGKGAEVLKDKFEVFEIHGARLVFKSGKIQKRGTVLYNIINFPKNYIERKKLKKLIKEFKPDLAITDYEPLTYILSKIYRIPLISIGNHHAIDYVKIKIPAKYYPQYLLTKAVSKSFTPKADFFIITSFLNIKNSKNIFFVPPIVREEVKKIKPKEKSFILCYFNNVNADKILPLLKQINEKFIIYGFNINKKHDNLEFRTKETFLLDLKDCKAIIATSGYTLISEALYLKKPYFAIPQRGQFEQVFNALTLKKEGFGEFSDQLIKENLENFLKNLNKYRKNLKKYKPAWDEIYIVLEKVLDKFIKKDLKTGKQ